jgi:hypothetical protein
VAVGRAYPLAARFLWECLNSPSMTRFLGPAHRTGRAVFPDPALGLVSRQGMQARHPPAIPQPYEAQLLVEVSVAERPVPPPGDLVSTHQELPEQSLGVAVHRPIGR